MIHRTTTWMRQGQSQLALLVQSVGAVPGGLLAMWLGTLILMPHASVLGGEPLLYQAINLSVFLQFGAVLSLLVRDWGWVHTLHRTALVLVAAWLTEYVGSTTGVPFGRYRYTATLQPQLGGVPLLIPVAWMMMLPCAWAVGQCLTRKRGYALFLLCAGAVFTAWDLFLDPQMVSWGLWVWERSGGYFGIPWSNYVGWLVSAILITALVRPRPLRVLPFLVVYALTCLMEAVGLAFFWQQPGPAAVGLAAMGTVAWLAARRQTKCP